MDLGEVRSQSGRSECWIASYLVECYEWWNLSYRSIRIVTVVQVRAKIRCVNDVLQESSDKQ